MAYSNMFEVEAFLQFHSQLPVILSPTSTHLTHLKLVAKVLQCFRRLGPLRCKCHKPSSHPLFMIFVGCAVLSCTASLSARERFQGRAHGHCDLVSQHSRILVTVARRYTDRISQSLRLVVLKWSQRSPVREGVVGLRYF